jgi:hypothetical protein
VPALPHPPSLLPILEELRKGIIGHPVVLGLAARGGFIVALFGTRAWPGTGASRGRSLRPSARAEA